MSSRPAALLSAVRAAALPALALAAPCAGALPAPPALDGEGVFALDDGSERPRLRYADGRLSRNDSCAVRLGRPLNPKVPPLLVNGAPIGFC